MYQLEDKSNMNKKLNAIKEKLNIININKNLK